MNRSPWKIINIYIQILSCQSLRVFAQDGQTEVLCKHQKKPISPTVCSLFTQNIHRVIVCVFHSQSGKRKHKSHLPLVGPYHVIMFIYCYGDFMACQFTKTTINITMIIIIVITASLMNIITLFSS